MFPVYNAIESLEDCSVGFFCGKNPKILLMRFSSCSPRGSGWALVWNPRAQILSGLRESGILETLMERSPRQGLAERPSLTSLAMVECSGAAEGLLHHGQLRVPGLAAKHQRGIVPASPSHEGSSAPCSDHCPSREPEILIVIATIPPHSRGHTRPCCCDTGL